MTSSLDHDHTVTGGQLDRAAISSAGPTVAGRIVPRKSWPRPATPTDLVPNWAGEFHDFQDWVNFAKTRLTGTYDPLMGGEVKAICIDALGRRCTMGGHFMRARDEGAFPVRFFWDCCDPADGAERVQLGGAESPTGTNQKAPQ